MTCVEVMYHQPFASSSFSSYPRGASTGTAATGGCSGFLSGQGLSRMHHEPLDLGTTSLSSLSSPPSSSTVISSASAIAAASSSSSSTPSSSLPQTNSSINNNNTIYPASSFLLTPTSSGPPSGNTLISPSPPLLTSPIPPPSGTVQPQHPGTSPSSSSPPHHHHNHHNHHHQSSSSSSSFLTPPSSTHHNNNNNHHHQHHHTTTTSVEERCTLDRDICTEPKGAQYLTSNCVLFTYANGDVGDLVDDHFTQALSRGHDGSSLEHKQSGSKATVPMSARNFPPSFWNSSYYHQHQQYLQQNQHHPHHSFFSNPNLHHQQSHHLHHSTNSNTTSDNMGLHSTAHYFSPALHGFPNLQTEAWGYGLSSPATGMSYSHRHMPYDLSYSSTSRFGQNYNPFLMQPSVVRPTPFGAMTGQSNVSKDHSRSSRFSDHRLGSDYTTHPSFSAIDSLQEATKDLYWF